MHLRKESDGSISLSDIGLKIEITPRLLLGQAFSSESRKILDELIEGELEKALECFRISEENTPEFRNKLYHKEVTSILMKRIAFLERELVVNLHSSGECVTLNEELQEVREYAYSVWRYDSYYGFKSAKKYEEKNEL